MKYWLISLLLVSGWASEVWADTTAAAVPLELRIPKASNPNNTDHAYFTGLLVKALEKAANGRPVPRLVPTLVMAPERIVLELKLGRTIDIFWMGVTTERAQDLLAIPIPLERGLIGFRQFVVRKDRAADFDKVTTLADLQQLKACVGAQWVDARILSAAELPIVTGVSLEGLFRQLAARRCDYFPRAVYEANIEMSKRAETYPQLMVYNKLMVHYPFAVYFFVRRDNQQLAQWIQQGLEQLIESGELLEYMQTQPHTRMAFPLQKHNQQRFLRLHNYTLPTNTNLNDRRYWFQLQDFTRAR